MIKNLQEQYDTLFETAGKKAQMYGQMKIFCPGAGRSNY